MFCYAMTRAGKVNYVGECVYGPFRTAAEMYTAFASSILSIVYDISTVSSADDPTVTNINRFDDIMIDYSTPGRYLVEFFPWMLYIPSFLAKWKREAKEANRYFTQLFEGMVHDVQKRIVRSCSVSSSSLLIHPSCRTKGTKDRVSLGTCFENAIVTTSVTRSLLGCPLRCSTFGFFS